ncbi:MAG: helix-turn-helix domain-containing protein [Acidimicrobiia bacterium]
MGERERARALRAQAWTLEEIAQEVGASRSSVSVWVRDVEFEPKPRQRPVFATANPLHLRRLAEIEAMNRWGTEQVGTLTDAAFLAAGRRCTRAKARRGMARSASRIPTQRWSGSSVHGSAGTSRSTSRAFGSGSISTRDSTSRPRTAFGRR